MSDDITVFAASKMLSVKLIIIPTPYPDSCSDFVGAESGILLLRFSLTDQEVLKSWITAHPEVTLGSLGEFETCPDWVPVMDTHRRRGWGAKKWTSIHQLCYALMYEDDA